MPHLLLIMFVCEDASEMTNLRSLPVCAPFCAVGAVLAVEGVEPVAAEQGSSLQVRWALTLGTEVEQDNMLQLETRREKGERNKQF